MKTKYIDPLRLESRILIRELGLLQLNNANSEVSPGHWHALIEISREPGTTISKLGQQLLMSVSTISRLVSSLTRHGFLILQAGNDKREKYLRLTNKGQSEIQKIDAFSNSKIKGAFELLTSEEIDQIITSISIYSHALEKSRMIRENVTVATLPTSRTVRKQIVNMIADIQANEFQIPITDEINLCVLRAEADFYYGQSYNFWYATDDKGRIIGSIGLKKVDNQHAEVKKFFVTKEYRGKGVAQKLLETLLKAASKHQFDFLVLGTVDTLKAAHRFYNKYGFELIEQKNLPGKFDVCHLDTVFFKANVKELATQSI